MRPFTTSLGIETTRLDVGSGEGLMVLGERLERLAFNAAI